MIIQQLITPNTRTLNTYFREIKKYKALSHEEESQLFRNNSIEDSETINKLIQHNFLFVVSVAKQYQGLGLDLEDLISEGNLGLIKAAHRFDPSKGFRFISFAVSWIKQAIIDALTRVGRTIRYPQNVVQGVSHMRKAVSTLTQKLERTPTNEEICEHLGVTPLHLSKTRAAESRISMIDAPFKNKDGEDGSTLENILFNEADFADEEIRKSEKKAEAHKLLQKLTPRECEVIKMSMGIDRESEVSYEEIGRLYGISKERVRQIRAGAIKKMRA